MTETLVFQSWPAKYLVVSALVGVLFYFLAGVMYADSVLLEHEC